jgi:hypothetical protein
MSKYIIREIESDATDFSIYFDGDCFNENAGGYNYNVFVIGDRSFCAYNADAYKEAVKEMDDVINNVDDIINKESEYENIIELCEDYKIPYSSDNEKALTALATRDYDEKALLCDYLSIKTGKKWINTLYRGYCQGDYIYVIYCEDVHSKELMDIFGNLFLGCGKEFCVLEMDENNEEVDSCYGYFVADCQVSFDPMEYKKIVCENAGIDEKETVLEMVDSVKTYTKVTYKQY